MGKSQFTMDKRARPIIPPAVIRRNLFAALLLLALPLLTRSQGQVSDPISPEEDKWLKELAGDSPQVTNLQAQDVMPRWYSMFSHLPVDYANGASVLSTTGSIPTIAGFGALTLGLLQTDNSTWRATRKFFRQSYTAREVSNYAITLGDGRLHLAIAGAFAGFGWLTDDPRALRTASQTVEAFLATGLTVQLLKRITGRESPAASTRHSGRWKFFPHFQQYNKHQPSYYSFPSGHLSTATATLIVIADNYPAQRWIRPVGYTLSAVLGASLVAKGMHWYSDLPLGFGLGYLFGEVVARPESEALSKVSGSRGLNVSLAPEFNGRRGNGISLALAF